MATADRPLVWLHGEVKTPPFSTTARVEAGVLLRTLQRGESIPMPRSRPMPNIPMPNIGKRCRELRVPDRDKTWRIVYRTDPDAVVIAEVFEKKTRTTPKQIIESAQRRLRLYNDATT